MNNARTKKANTKKTYIVIVSAQRAKWQKDCSLFFCSKNIKYYLNIHSGWRVCVCCVFWLVLLFGFIALALFVCWAHLIYDKCDGYFAKKEYTWRFYMILPRRLKWLKNRGESRKFFLNLFYSIYCSELNLKSNGFFFVIFVLRFIQFSYVHNEHNIR